jgi:hypothetical protein
MELPQEILSRLPAHAASRARAGVQMVRSLKARFVSNSSAWLATAA